MQMIKERDVRSLLEAQEASYREMVRSPEKSKAEFFSQFVWDEDWESAYGLLKGRSHSGFFGLRDPEECLIRKIDTFEVAKHSLVFTPYFHRHSFLELDYVYRGSCRYYIGNTRKSFILRENELCFINQNITHAISTEGEEDIVLKCQIPFDFLRPLEEWGRAESMTSRLLLSSLGQGSAASAYLIFSLSPRNAVKEAVLNLLFESFRKETGWEEASRNYLSLLMIALEREEEGNLAALRDFEITGLTPAFILGKIRSAPAKTTLDSLAKEMGYHKNYLSRLIKKETGKTFRELLIEARIQKASTLLGATRLSIEEIAYQVGYEKASSLYKVFKENEGITPAQYRRRHLKP